MCLNSFGFWKEALQPKVWPQTDGYDYSFQVDYPSLWSRSINAFRASA